MTVSLFAGISVSDYAAALAWYEVARLPAVVLPARHGGRLGTRRTPVDVHLRRPEHAGHAMHTLIVDDLDAVVAEIAQRGLEPASQETYSNGVRPTYVDPDGNEIGFGGVPG